MKTKNLSEVEKLYTKTKNIYLSCTNKDQLKVARRFSELARKKIQKLGENTVYFTILDHAYYENEDTYEL